MFGRGKLGLLMAMAMMMGGSVGAPPRGEPNYYKPKRKLTPEEEAQELEQKKVKFLSDLEKQNGERRILFPKFKEFEVHGLIIVAFNQKNAIRDLNILMQNNLIQIKTT